MQQRRGHRLDRQKKIRNFEMWIWRRMEKISWLDKVTVLRRVNEDRQILNCIWQRKHRWIGHVLRHDGLLHEIFESRKRGKSTVGGEELTCYMIQQMMMAVLHSNGQLRTERYEYTQKGCQKPAVQQKTTDAD